MIDTLFIEEQTRKLQTTRDNVTREYCQHLFLSKFYQKEGAEKILFKGGTALRILWRSPRFSEDLDFSGMKISQAEVEDILEAVLIETQREGLDIDIRESKKTTGGYLCKLLFRWVGFSASIQLEISQRKGSLRAEQTLVQSDFLPAYVAFCLSEQDMVHEKIMALLERGKPRDFFDLYFILRSRRILVSLFRQDKSLKKKILEKLHKTAGSLSFPRELKQFLPTSHHSLLRNFPAILEKELQRVVPSVL